MKLSSFLIELQRNKLPYYIQGHLRQLLPRAPFERLLGKKLRTLSKFAPEEIFSRVDYYNKLQEFTAIGADAVEITKVRKVKASAYVFDTLEYTRYFPRHFKAHFILTDVIHVPEVPTIQKARPIRENNSNAVLMNLDKKRHFLFIKDPIPFRDKRDLMIGRGSVTQPHRIAFMNKYFGTPLVDLGQVNKIEGNPEWIKPRLPIFEHLRYKFILSLEGNDVATNLKWIMSSNSVAVMPKPRYETWFMEGRLIPNFHYIQIKDDFSDLTEVLEYYISHPDEAEKIAKNANEYVRQFQDSEKEDLISLLVLKKYFSMTSQWSDQVSSDGSSTRSPVRAD